MVRLNTPNTLDGFDAEEGLWSGIYLVVFFQCVLVFRRRSLDGHHGTLWLPVATILIFVIAAIVSHNVHSSQSPADECKRWYKD